MLEHFSIDTLEASAITQEDFFPLYAMYQDEKVMATLGGLRDASVTQKNLTSFLNHWKQHHYGVWIFKEQETGTFVGRCGLLHTTIDDEETIELLYALMPHYWGKGLATAIAKKLVSIAFDELDLPELVCFTLVENHASQRVMEKAGFVYEKNITHANLEHVLYRLKNPAKQ